MDSLKLDLAHAALKLRRTKIVATVGPASSSFDRLVELIEAGVDVFRLNFSHGSHDSHREAYQLIREAQARTEKLVAVVGDLCGPKIRVGKFEGGSIVLEPKERVIVTTRPEVLGRPGLLPSEYQSLASDVKAGDRILLDDGRLELRVVGREGTEIACEVVQGGRLSDRKGMNLPGVAVSAAALTEKDRVDAAFAASLGVDYLALSFVRSGADVETLKKLLFEVGHPVPVIAKVEKPEALESIESILRVADAIMVARGDLGVEMEPEWVPLVQQELIRLSALAHRPVIVATQMLESMVENPRPTRAEVTDVAGAAMAQADAVMLSAETASGRHPVEAVEAMDRILRRVEGYQWKHGRFGVVLQRAEDVSGPVDMAAAVARATSLLSRDSHVRAVVVPSKTGATVKLVASKRPAAPVIALSHDRTLCQRLCLCWGVHPELVDREKLKEPVGLAREIVRRQGLAEPGQHSLLVWDSDPSSESLVPTMSLLTV